MISGSECKVDVWLYSLCWDINHFNYTFSYENLSKKLVLSPDWKML